MQDKHLQYANLAMSFSALVISGVVAVFTYIQVFQPGERLRLEVSRPAISEIARCCVIVKGSIFLSNLSNERILIRELDVMTRGGYSEFIRSGGSKERFLIEPRSTIEHDYEVAFMFDESILPRILGMLKKYDPTIDTGAPIYEIVDDRSAIVGERESEDFLLFLSGAERRLNESGSFLNVDVFGDACEARPLETGEDVDNFFYSLDGDTFFACIEAAVEEIGSDERFARMWPIEVNYGEQGGTGSPIGRGWIPDAMGEKRP